MKKITGCLLLAGILMMPLRVMAQAPQAGNQAQDAGGMREDMEKEVGLTQEQKDQMKAFREEFKVKQQLIQEDLRNKRAELGKELEMDAPDRAKIEKIITDINGLQGQIMLNNADLVLKVRGLMTPEQIKKVKEIREERRAKAAAAAPKTLVPAAVVNGADKKK